MILPLTHRALFILQLVVGKMLAILYHLHSFLNYVGTLPT